MGFSHSVTRVIVYRNYRAVINGVSVLTSSLEAKREAGNWFRLVRITGEAGEYPGDRNLSRQSAYIFTPIYVYCQEISRN